MTQLSPACAQHLRFVSRNGQTYLRARMPSPEDKRLAPALRGRQIVQFLKPLPAVRRAAVEFSFCLPEHFDLKSGKDMFGGKMGFGLVAGSSIPDPANNSLRQDWVKPATLPSGGYPPSLPERMSARLMFRYSARLQKTVLGLYAYTSSLYPGHPEILQYGLNLQVDETLRPGLLHRVWYEVDMTRNRYRLQLNSTRRDWQLDELTPPHSWGKGFIDGLWFSHFYGGPNSGDWQPAATTCIDYGEVRVAGRLEELTGS